MAAKSTAGLQRPSSSSCSALTSSLKIGEFSSALKLVSLPIPTVHFQVGISYDSAEYLGQLAACCHG
eukprot:882123-Rhodomonas_salina.1